MTNQVQIDAHKAERVERARRKQVIVQTIAEMIDQAKSLLLTVKQVAADNDIDVDFDKFMEEVGIEKEWYNSNDTC